MEYETTTFRNRERLARSRGLEIIGSARTSVAAIFCTIIKGQIMDDREIIRKLNRGGESKQQAWDHMAVRYEKTIRYWVGKYRANFHALRRNVDQEDAVQHVKTLLPKLVARFDADKATLSTYLPFRIRGTILDMLRGPEWRLGLTSYTNRKRGPIQGTVSLSETVVKPLSGGRRIEFASWLEDRSPTSFAQRCEDFRHVVGGLPQQQRQVLYLYYVRELNMREVGEVLDISESRISQIHSYAIERLRETMNVGIETNSHE